ncbi:MAG TPA: OmpA family protein [Dissulfurispiraceae bacterium]|nr:OmpA family protein [Dissulfurispiraceae bacterium]
MKRYMILSVMIAVMLLILAGCSSQYRVAGQADQADFAKQQRAGDPAGAASGGRTESITERDMTAARPADVQSRLRELQQKVRDINFDYDRYNIREDAKPILKEVAGLMGRAKGVKLVIEGHCDQRGTTEYNLGLGERRAHSAKEYLIALGIPSSRIETISFGQEKPLCAEASEACWANNRRAHFVFVEEVR